MLRCQGPKLAQDSRRKRPWRASLFLGWFLLSACGGATTDIDPRPAGRGSTASPRLILLGLDAADARLIDEGIAAGRLPNFARIVREGTVGPLRTHRPILSPILWTTMATGLTPDRHGVLDFVEEGPDGRIVPITSRARRAPAFWEMLAARGTTPAVVGWLATWPADPIPGIIVSDRFTIHPFAPGAQDARGDADEVTGSTYPPELHEALRGVIVDPSSLTNQDLAGAFGEAIGSDANDSAERRELSVIEAVTRTYAAAALKVARERRPALLALYCDGIDRLMHFFGPCMPPAMAGVDRDKAARYGDVVARFYARIDRLVGDFLDLAGRDGTLIIVSDHGFKIGDERPRHTSSRSDIFAAEWHRDPGIIMAWGHGIRSGGRIEGADIYDVAPTVLAFFGAPATVAMRGRALADLFEPGFLPAAPAPVADEERTLAPVALGEHDEEILENLRALGYVSGASRETGSANGSVAPTRAANNLATFFLDEGQTDKAIALYRGVLERAPHDPTALFNLGFALKERGRNEEAAALFERAIGDRPDDLEARIALSECRLGLGQPAAALAALRGAPASAQADAGYLNHLGSALAGSGQLDEAERTLRRAIAAAPAEAGASLNLARVQSMRGDRKGALATLKAARERSPGDRRVAERIAELEKGG